MIVYDLAVTRGTVEQSMVYITVTTTTYNHEGPKLQIP